jgi:hypothetical protein
MASQLAIEITLEQAAGCLFSPVQGSGTEATYQVANVNLIPEILQFDASYDSMFLRGLREGGVPIKFSSWHTFIFSSGSGSQVQLLIQERSRSVKALFAVQRRAQANIGYDNGATFFDTAASGASSLQNYQYRVGGRYFPAAPVQCSMTTGSAVSNGGCEAYVELSKALNIVGDYRLTTGVNPLTWGVCTDSTGLNAEYDFKHVQGGYSTGASPAYLAIEGSGSSFCGNVGSANFGMAINLETSNGVEISGLNAEEQSDIALIAGWALNQVTGSSNTASNIEVYSYYDAMIVLRENNVRYPFLYLGVGTYPVTCCIGAYSIMCVKTSCEKYNGFWRN